MSERGGDHPDRRARLHSRVFRLDPDLDPFDLAGDQGFAWASPSGELVGLGAAAHLRLGAGRDRLQRAADGATALLGGALVDDPESSGLGPVAAGAIPFADASPGRLTVPELALRRGPDRALWAVATAAGRPPRPSWPGRRPRPAAWPAQAGGWPEVLAVLAPARQDRAGFRAAVATALEAIATGRLDKVVLARELLVQADRPFSRQAVLRRLRERAAGAYVYASDGFVGASPELLLARRGSMATSQPMAGTVAVRGPAGEQARRLAWLRSSDKEAAEHRVVVEMVAEALAKVADRVAVAPVEVVRLATVAHLATLVRAELTRPLPSALELAGLLHPTPAVAGAPRDAALDLLAELEPFDRGPYAGPVGWVDHHGDGEWAVALRCATLDGPVARLVAGAGVVAGSDPAAEWAETGDKLEAMLDVLSGR
jgi:menaquinone-specific isochorismate synthase